MGVLNRAIVETELSLIMNLSSKSPPVSPKPPYTVLVIDDHPLFLKGAAQILAMDSDFKMVGNAIDGAQGIELALQLEPHLVLLDINMAGMDGMAVLTELKHQNFSGLIIMLTVSADTQDITLALQQGADGYLLKDMQPEDILRKLRYAINHQPVTVLDATIANTLVEMLRNEGMVPSMARVSFSDREQEVITCIAEGKSNKLIARSMDISEGTVKVYVKNILRKLNLSSRLEAAIWAVDHGY